MSGNLVKNKQLPKEWVHGVIGDLCEIITGNTPSKKELEYYGYFMPFVKPPELKNYLINCSDDNLSEIGAEKARVLPKDSILISCIGNLGKVGMNSVPVAFNQQINAIKPSLIFFPKFLFYQVQSTEFKLQLESLASATTVPIVNKGKFSTIDVKIPPLPEQNQIVAKIEELFSELDNGIETLKRAREQLKTYRQAVLKYAFEGKLTNSDTENWEYAFFKNCLTFSQGIQVGVNLQSEVRRTGQVRFLRISDFTQGNDPERYIDKPGAKYIVATEDISLVRYGASTGFVCTGLNGAIANNLFQIIPHEKIFKKYLYYFLKSSFFQQVIAQKIKGAAMPAISFGLINNVELPIPSTLAEQQTIVSEIETRLSVCDKLEQTIEDSLKKSEALRQSILKKASSGELTKDWREKHPELVTGENSAEKLLEKIKAEKTLMVGRKKQRRKKTKKK